MNQAKEKGAEIEKNYNEKFGKFLTAKQLYKMKEAEDAFNQRMMNDAHGNGNRRCKQNKRSPNSV